MDDNIDESAHFFLPDGLFEEEAAESTSADDARRVSEASLVNARPLHSILEESKSATEPPPGFETSPSRAPPILGDDPARLEERIPEKSGEQDTTDGATASESILTMEQFELIISAGLSEEPDAEEPNNCRVPGDEHVVQPLQGPPESPQSSSSVSSKSEKIEGPDAPGSPVALVGQQASGRVIPEQEEEAPVRSQVLGDNNLQKRSTLQTVEDFVDPATSKPTHLSSRHRSATLSSSQLPKVVAPLVDKPKRVPSVSSTSESSISQTNDVGVDLKEPPSLERGSTSIRPRTTKQSTATPSVLPATYPPVMEHLTTFVALLRPYIIKAYDASRNAGRCTYLMTKSACQLTLGALASDHSILICYAVLYLIPFGSNLLIAFLNFPHYTQHVASYVGLFWMTQGGVRPGRRSRPASGLIGDLMLKLIGYSGLVAFLSAGIFRVVPMVTMRSWERLFLAYSICLLRQGDILSPVGLASLAMQVSVWYFLPTPSLVFDAVMVVVGVSSLQVVRRLGDGDLKAR